MNELGLTDKQKLFLEFICSSESLSDYAKRKSITASTFRGRVESYMIFARRHYSGVDEIKLLKNVSTAKIHREKTRVLFLDLFSTVNIVDENGCLINLKKRTSNSLTYHLGITQAIHIAFFREEELLLIPNIGPGSVNEIKSVLESLNLNLDKDTGEKDKDILKRNLKERVDAFTQSHKIRRKSELYFLE